MVKSWITGTAEVGEGNHPSNAAELWAQLRITWASIEGIAAGTDAQGVATVAVTKVVTQTKNLESRAGAQVGHDPGCQGLRGLGRDECPCKVEGRSCTGPMVMGPSS